MFLQDKVTFKYKNKYQKKTYSLKEKILFTGFILCMVTILSQIPLFGINRDLIESWMNSDITSNLGVFGMFAGTSFERLSIFALGIAPYITSSIILQLLRVAFPKLDSICKDGQEGQKLTERYTYIGAGLLAILQIIPMMYNFVKNGLLIENNALYIGLVGSGLFIGGGLLIALGKIIDKRGIGNGISLILLMNILSSMPSDFVSIFEVYVHNKRLASGILAIIITFLIIIGTLIAVIFLQEGQKEIKTTFSSKISNNRMSKNSRLQESIIPLKVNLSGVMPIIFASSLMQMFPLGVNLFEVDSNKFIFKLSKYFNQSNWFNAQDMKYTLGLLLYVVLVICFAYFYQMISFNTAEIANNLAKQGGTIKGIRPGKPTEEFLNKQLKYLILLGALMLIGIALIPMMISGFCNLGLSFGGTSVLIIVSVIVETYNKIKVEKKGVSQKGFLR